MSVGFDGMCFEVHCIYMGIFYYYGKCYFYVTVNGFFSDNGPFISWIALNTAIG